MVTNAQTPDPPARILVVDDEPEEQQFVRTALEEAGYIVETVGDGETALARLKASRPDLLVVDLIMPGMDGMTLIAAVRQEEALNDVPIILMTGKVGIGGIQRHHPDMCLTKPYNPQELLGFVKRLLTTGTTRGIVYERSEIGEGWIRNTSS